VEGFTLAAFCTVTELSFWDAVTEAGRVRGAVTVWINTRLERKCTAELLWNFRGFF